MFWRRRAIAVFAGTLAILALVAGCGSRGPAVEPVAGVVPAPTKGDAAMTFELTTTAFTPAESLAYADRSRAVIPAEHAMNAMPGGRNVSIPYSWSGAPAATRSFAFVLVDTAPVAREWVHWLVVDIPRSATSFPSGASRTSAMPEGAMELGNTFGFLGYGGPQPPSGTGAHAYVATLYALDLDALRLPANTTLAEFRRAIDGHVLASATSTGLLER